MRRELKRVLFSVAFALALLWTVSLCFAGDPLSASGTPCPAGKPNCGCGCQAGGPCSCGAAVAQTPKKDPPPVPTPNAPPAAATIVLTNLGPATKVTFNGVTVDGYGTARTYTSPAIDADSHYTVVASGLYGVGESVTADVTISPGKTTTAVVDWYGQKITFRVGPTRTAPPPVVRYYQPTPAFVGGFGGGCSGGRCH